MTFTRLGTAEENRIADLMYGLPYANCPEEIRAQVDKEIANPGTFPDLGPTESLDRRRDEITAELMPDVKFEQLYADSPLRPAIDRIIELEQQADRHMLMNARADVLREAVNDLSWFGAQGNLVEPDTAWAGVKACMDALREKADRLQNGESS